MRGILIPTGGNPREIDIKPDAISDALEPDNINKDGQADPGEEL